MGSLRHAAHELREVSEAQCNVFSSSTSSVAAAFMGKLSAGTIHCKTLGWCQAR